jgi:hypothetical protein
MFASYLTTSFDVVDDPRYQLESRSGCYCELCSHLVQSPHLVPKRITGGEKAHARRLKVAALVELACDGGRTLDRAEALELLARADISMNAAFVAYANQLILRQSGDPGDPAVLAPLARASVEQRLAEARLRARGRRYRWRAADALGGAARSLMDGLAGITGNDSAEAHAGAASDHPDVRHE